MVNIERTSKSLTLALGSAFIAAVLVSCAQDTTPTPTPSPPLPTDAPRALVIEAVDSPIYEELKKGVRMVQYDGSQKAAEHDLVILDGDVHVPEDVEGHPLVAEAVREGKAVLVVDASQAHKRDGLGKFFGFASKGNSPGYLARLTYDQNHRAEVRVVEFPSEVTPTFSNETATMPMNVSAPGAVAAFADRALTALSVPRVAAQQDGYSPYPCGGRPNTASLGVAQAGGGETIPAGAIYKHVYYCVPVQWQTEGTANVKGTQNPYFDTNYTFTIILDNGNEPQGNFQYVAAQMDVSAVSNGGPSGAQPILSNQNGDRGWFQDRITLNLQPADGSLFSSVSDSPETANNTAQVTTGFSVGFTVAKDPNVTGSYSNSQTVNLPDWSVTNNSSGNAKAWNFKSANPIDADNLNGGYTGFTGEVKALNQLNTSQLQFHAQSAWKTGSVQAGWVDFTTHTVQNVANVAIVCDNSDPEWPTCKNHTATGGMGSQPTLSLYMGAVVPVPIQGISFSQNPAPVVNSNTITGTIILSKPAPEDIVIPLSSTDPSHASVLPTVTVKQGETSANFPVNIATNGGTPGNTVTAQIIAFYAQNYQAALNVKTIAATGLQPPTTAPTLDQTKYAQCAGDSGKWAPGYLVRYAASFVNGTGETDRGPWTNWTNHSPFMLPNLQNVPTDPTGNATSRKVYRQFFSDFSETNPSAGVTLTGTLNDNTTTQLQDEDTAGTPVGQCQ